eukprot:SAG31_NODE_13098_length_892_cov_1.844893_1_plen_275_part_10
MARYTSGLAVLDPVVAIQPANSSTIESSGTAEQTSFEEPGVAQVLELRKVLHCNRAAASLGWVKAFDSAAGQRDDTAQTHDADAGADANDRQALFSGTGSTEAGEVPADVPLHSNLAVPKDEVSDSRTSEIATAARQSRWREALLVSGLRDTDAASAIAPRWAKPWFRRGKILELLGDFSAASAALQQAVEVAGGPQAEAAKEATKALFLLRTRHLIPALAPPHSLSEALVKALDGCNEASGGLGSGRTSPAVQYYCWLSGIVLSNPDDLVLVED